MEAFVFLHYRIIQFLLIRVSAAALYNKQDRTVTLTELWGVLVKFFWLLLNSSAVTKIDDTHTHTHTHTYIYIHTLESSKGFKNKPWRQSRELSQQKTSNKNVLKKNNMFLGKVKRRVWVCTVHCFHNITPKYWNATNFDLWVFIWAN